jgi:signal transduction histidine kinase/DNA-binding response OmpR family regulator
MAEGTPNPVAKTPTPVCVDEFQYLLTHFPGAVSIYDSDLDLIAANDLHYEMTGLPRDRYGPGSPYAEIVRFIAESGGYGEVDIEATILDRIEAMRHLPWKFERKQGERFIVGHAVATPNGGVICCQQDLTEQKRTEMRLRALADDLRVARDQAEAASRAKSEFLAMMSHEIRTPMNGVLGMAEILANSKLDDRQREFLNVLTDSGRALLRIIDDILDFSKIEAGKLVLDLQPFNLRDTVEDVATLLAAKAAERGVDLSVRYDPRLPERLLGDASRVRQIITNLVGNAVKFTHEGYVLINVDGDVVDGRARLAFSVTDTGIGIPADKLERIFEQFEQVDVSSTRRYGGTGLGLAISRRLVLAMDGEIGVRSTVGEGTTFWFRILLPTAAEEVETQAPPADLTGATALIVDDIEVNRTILREQLTCWGMKAVSARSGPDALALARQALADGAPFEVAVLDYHMPDMDGVELARRISDELGDKAPRLIVLSSASDDLAPTARRYGVTDCLIKPARGSHLRAVLAKALTVSRAPARDAVAPAPESSRPIPRKARVLLAEDNAVNRTVVLGMLEDLPLNIDIAENGAAAFSAYCDMPPDLVLMDVSMPVMDGYEAARSIREHERKHDLPRVPIVALTAHVLAGDKERCFQAGMDDFLGKPVETAKLRSVVAIWLEPAEVPARRIAS